MLTHFPSESLSDSQWGPEEKVVKHFGGVGVDAGALLWNKGGKREAEGKTVRGMQFCLV